MTGFRHAAFFDSLRPHFGEHDGALFPGKITQARVDVFKLAIDAGFGIGTKKAAPRDAEPAWLAEARRLIGTREIPGPQHNGWIAKGWARLGAGWFTDDETPWCGMFVAHCMQSAGQPYPALFPRAKAWADWGKPCPPCLGAVVVFGREGGGHVGFLVGHSATNFYVLGGNQSDAVTITPIAKARKLAIRWPLALPLTPSGLPEMSGGTVSRNEA